MGWDKMCIVVNKLYDLEPKGFVIRNSSEDLYIVQIGPKKEAFKAKIRGILKISACLAQIFQVGIVQFVDYLVEHFGWKTPKTPRQSSALIIGGHIFNSLR